MAKKRTKAQRAAAAKASWERRRKGLPPLTKTRGKHKPTPVIDVLEMAPITLPLAQPLMTERVILPPPQIVYAVQEGDEIFVCFAQDGSLNRNKVSDAAARKLLRDLSAILI